MTTAGATHATSDGKRPVRLLAAAGGLIGGVVLVGWWLRLPALTSIVPGFVTMKPNSAMGLVLGAVALWLLAPSRDARVGIERRHLAGYAAAVLCSAIGAITLAEYALHIHGGIDQLVARVDLERVATSTPGRMAVTTAITFVLLGGGLLMLDVEEVRWARTGELLLGAAMGVPVAVIVGYVYRVIPTRGIGQGLQMALHTAVAFLALGCGAFLARPERDFVRTLRSDGAGGILARRMLPAALGIPFALGATRLVGERAGVIDLAGGSAAVTAGTMLLLAWLVWRTAAEIDRTELARTTAEWQSAVARDALAAAEAASAAKTQFLATMSHELRTPLNAIGGYTELIELGVYGPVTEPQLEALARIRRSSAHLLGLVGQVLSLARVEGSHGIELEITDVPVDAVLSSLEVFIAPQCRERAQTYDVASAAPGLVIRADYGRVEQVLVNLLSNAVKFTPAGGRITVRATAEESGAIAIRVVDTGRGVPVSHRESIFQPFVQVDVGLTRRTDGVGLGLSISRDLARAMDGDVVLERSDGSGSTFTLLLPAAGVDRTRTPTARRTPASALELGDRGATTSPPPRRTPTNS